MEIRPQTGKSRIAYPTLVAAGTIAAAMALTSCERESQPLGGIAPQPLGGDVPTRVAPAPAKPDNTTTKLDEKVAPRPLGGVQYSLNEEGSGIYQGWQPDGQDISTPEEEEAPQRLGGKPEVPANGK